MKKWLWILTFIWVLWVAAEVNTAKNAIECESTGGEYLKHGMKYECRR